MSLSGEESAETTLEQILDSVIADRVKSSSSALTIPQKLSFAEEILQLQSNSTDFVIRKLVSRFVKKKSPDLRKKYPIDDPYLRRTEQLLSQERGRTLKPSTSTGKSPPKEKPKLLPKRSSKSPPKKRSPSPEKSTSSPKTKSKSTTKKPSSPKPKKTVPSETEKKPTKSGRSKSPRKSAELTQQQPPPVQPFITNAIEPPKTSKTKAPILTTSFPPLTSTSVAAKIATSGTVAKEVSPLSSPRRRPSATTSSSSTNVGGGVVDDSLLTQIDNIITKRYVRRTLLNILWKRRTNEKTYGRIEPINPEQYQTSGYAFREELRTLLKPEEVNQFELKPEAERATLTGRGSKGKKKDIDIVTKNKKTYYTLVDYVKRMEEIASAPGRYIEIKKPGGSVEYEGLASGTGIVRKKTAMFVPDKPYNMLVGLYKNILARKVIEMRTNSNLLSEIENINNQIDRKSKDLTSLRRNKDTTRKDLNLLYLNLQRVQGVEPLWDNSYRILREKERNLEVQINDLERSILTLRNTVKRLQQQSDRYIPPEVRRRIMDNHPELSYNASDYEIAMIWIKERWPEDEKKIQEAVRTTMFRDGEKLVDPWTGKKTEVNTMPLDIVADSVALYASDENTYAFMHALVEIVLQISAPSDDEEIYNVLVFDHIPDQWFESAEKWDPNNAELIRQDQTRYISKVCEWILSALKSYDPWCRANLKGKRGGSSSSRSSIGSGGRIYPSSRNYLSTMFESLPEGTSSRPSLPDVVGKNEKTLAASLAPVIAKTTGKASIRKEMKQNIHTLTDAFL